MALRLTPVNAATIPTTLQSSIVYRGVTFTLDAPHPVGTFEDGSPFIVSDGAGSISATSVPVVDVNSDGHLGNGMMKNPFTADAEEQGFDEWLGDFVAASYNTPYVASTNVDPSASNTASWTTGEKASFVKSIRKAGKSSGAEADQTIDRYITLTVLDAAPPAGTVRPGMAGTAKILRSYNDVNFTPRNLTLPASWPSITDIFNSVPDDIPMLSNGERLRGFRTDPSFNTATTGYSGVTTPFYARFIYALQSSALTAQQRKDIILKIMVVGGDVEAVLDIGGGLSSTAGQGGSIWLWIMAYAALTQDTALYNKAVNSVQQPDRTSLWVSAANVGAAAPTKNGITGQTYFDAHLNTPWMEPEQQSSGHDARYSEIGASINSWETLAVLSMPQGPAGRANGYEMILDGGANDTTNAKASKLAFAAMWNTWTGPFYSAATAYQPGNDWRDAWAQMVATAEFTPYTGPPEQPPMASNTALNDDYFTAGDGSITLNTQGIAHATETITQTDMRYSLDRVQWIEVSNITLSSNQYTQTGLLRGKTHWASWRRQSASGAGHWSANHPTAAPIVGGTLRSQVTTSGTEANAAPVNTVAPTIHQRLHPSWEYPVWEPAPATLGINDIELAAGVGYWSGFPAPTFTYQWKRGGVNISGATSQVYTRVAADAGAVLTCDITATNSQGSTVATTAGITCPALNTPPAGTLIDTDFKGAFAVDYEAVLATFVESSVTMEHLYAEWPNGDASVNPGVIRWDKTAGFPQGDFALTGSSSTNYNYSGQAVVYAPGSNAVDRASWFFEVIDGDSNTLATLAEIDGVDVLADEEELVFVNFSGSFTSLTSSAFRIRARWPNGAGGTDGGDAYLTQLTISEA